MEGAAMNPTIVSMIIIACTFGGALLGIWLRPLLPEHHLDDESRDTVKRCFGLYAPRNGTVVAVIFVCALTVSSAVFLVLEMETPFDGLLKISADPFHHVYAHLNQ